MFEGEDDALPTQHQDPSVHRREHADDFDARCNEHEGPERRRVDPFDLIPDQLKNTHTIDLVTEEHPKREHRDPRFEEREDACAGLALGRAEANDGHYRDAQDLDQSRHRTGSPSCSGI